MTDGGPASHGGSAIGHIGGGASARGTVRVTERVQIVQVQCMGYQCMCAQAVIPTLKLPVAVCGTPRADSFGCLCLCACTPWQVGTYVLLELSRFRDTGRHHHDAAGTDSVCSESADNVKVVGPCAAPDELKLGSETRFLQGVVVHRGSSVTDGHFVAYVRVDSGTGPAGHGGTGQPATSQWLEVDDAAVTVSSLVEACRGDGVLFW